MARRRRESCLASTPSRSGAQSRACWFVQIGQKQIRLAPDRDEAFRLYHEVMARPPEESTAPPPPSTAALAAVEVIDLFLEWACEIASASTYEAYQRRLQAWSTPSPRPCDGTS